MLDMMERLKKFGKGRLKNLYLNRNQKQSNQAQINTKALAEVLEKDPKFIFKCGITPQILPQLIEKNPPIAGTVIIKLNTSPNISQYLEKMIEMELSLPSLEVVNRVATSCELPKEFLTLYITNCISYCESQKKDKNAQGRLVRLVCVFVKSLIKAKIINPAEMFIELQAFCIDFSKISEANQLFKMLKSLDPTQNTGSSHN